jgi:hypothetical protein
VGPRRATAPVPAVPARRRWTSVARTSLLALSLAGCRGATPAGVATSAATVALGDHFRATLDSAAGTLTLEVGPLRLGPAGSGDAMAITPPRAVALPMDGWLRGVGVELVDGRGRRLPRAPLHHVNLIAPERRELFSPIMLRVGAAGPETAPMLG